MILSDRDLQEYFNTKQLSINPLYGAAFRENGLDLHLAPEISRVKDASKVYDPKVEKSSDKWWERGEAESFVLKPHEKVLSRTLEYIKMPMDLGAFCYLRSSYARMGMKIPPTVVDASFEGTLTIEIKNGPFPVKMYMEDRFMHLIFTKAPSPSAKGYDGKYKGQVDVTPGKSDGGFG